LLVGGVGPVSPPNFLSGLSGDGLTGNQRLWDLVLSEAKRIESTILGRECGRYGRFVRADASLYKVSGRELPQEALIGEKPRLAIILEPQASMSMDVLLGKRAPATTGKKRLVFHRKHPTGHLKSWGRLFGKKEEEDPRTDVPF